jgi:endo-1,4-beta-mannosidase
MDRKQYMASEDDFAEYMRLVMPRVHEIGSLGAFTWCFADYATELWDVPPCGESRHERHFGLVRPDGSIKPHAIAIKEFAETKPLVKPIPAFAKFPGLTGDHYYAQKLEEYQPQLYQEYLKRKEG